MKKLFIFIVLLFIPTIVNAKVRINEKEYENLEAAMFEVKEGDTVTLLSDEDVSDITKYDDYYLWQFPDNATLDLNGHTVITGFTAENPNAVFLGNNLTIKNGKFISAANADYPLFVGDEEETSNIVLENLEISGGINIYNTLNVTIKDVTATGKKYYAVWLDNHVTATIKSGNYSTKGVAVVGVTNTKDFQNELIIEGGTFISNENNLSLSQIDKNRIPPKIKGGTYDFDVKEFVVEDYEVKKENDKYIVKEHTYDRDIILDNEDFTVNNENVSQIFIDSLNKTPEIDIAKKDISVVLNIKDLESNENIFNTVKEELKDVNIAKYYDINIDVIDKTEHKVIGSLSELTKKITLNISIPDDLIVKESINRTYYIIREHNNKIDIIEPTLSSDFKTLTFETDLFSTYALAYKDKELEDNKSDIQEPDNNDNNKVEVENPPTLDNLSKYIITSIASLLGIIGGVFYIKYNEKNKN